VYGTSGETNTGFNGHDAAVTSCAFSPDGSHVVSVSKGTFKVWNSSTGTEVRRIESTGDRACAFSPDGSSIVSGAWDHRLKLWD